MRKTWFVSILALACTLISATAADKAAMGLTKSDSSARFNMRYDGVPIKVVIADVVGQTNVNIIVSPDFLENKVTCRFTDVALLPALTSLVETFGCVLREQVAGSGIYTIRHSTPEEDHAASLRRFFDALRKEGFSEDQAMRILLCNQEKND